MAYDYSGNVINPVWFSTITKENGSADFIAINILADLIYWHTPTIKRDENTGVVVSIKKKFKADKLQKSYNFYSNLYGFSKDTIKRAFDKLEDLGLLQREFRNIFVDGRTVNNVMFVTIDNESITRISLPLLAKEGGVPPQKKGESGSKNRGTYTENTTENTEENTIYNILSKDNNLPIDSEDKSSPSIEPHGFYENGIEVEQIEKDCVPTPPTDDIDPTINNIIAGAKKKTGRGNANVNQILDRTEKALNKYGFIYNSSGKNERQRALNFTQSKKIKELSELGFESYEEYVDFILDKAKKFKITKRPINSVEGIFYNGFNVLNEYTVKYKDFDTKVFINHEWCDKILESRDEGRFIYRICNAVKELGWGLEQSMTEEKTLEWIQYIAEKYKKLDVERIFSELEKHRIYYREKYSEGDYLLSLDKRLDRVASLQ